MIALPAQGFVFVFLAQQHSLVVVYQTVADVGQGATTNTDGVHLCHLVCNGAKARNGAKGVSAIVHVQPGYNHAYAVVGQLVADVYKSVVKKLSFVDADNFDVGRQ